MKTHVNAATLVCVACEVVAVVLVTIAVASVTSQWWLTLICAGIGMTIGLFVLIFSIGRRAGRERARLIFSMDLDFRARAVGSSRTRGESTD